ncbi:MAG: metal ABC transporter substrate-binding protein [Ruminococcus sp.]
MKKLLSVLFILTIIFSATACGSAENSDKLSVVTTIFPYYDFANKTSNGLADLKMLISPGNDIHSYEPTPSDIASIKKCDLFIYNGGESDAWVDSILDSFDEEEKPQVMKMMDYVTPLTEVDADHNLGTEQDEHIWLSPTNAQNLLGMIGTKMGELDSKNQSTYKSNYTTYMKEISAVSQNIQSVVNSADSKKIVVGDRFPLIYFTNQYGIDWECAFPGCSSETEPSLSRMSSLQDTIKNENVKSIIKLDMSGNNVAQTLADETGAKVVTFYPCETISQEDFDRGETYATLMARNMTAIKEALSR